MLYFLEGAVADPAAGSQMGSLIITIVAMVAIFYFMLIRPEQKRKKEAEQLRSSLSVNDQVTTIGGIVGRVVDIKEDRFVMETSGDRVRIELMKWALSTNDTATAAAAEDAKKAEEAKAKAKAAKKAKKNADK